MNPKLQKIIKARNWQHFLTRSFTLFGASLQNQWYLGEESIECLGLQRDERLFVEENTMRYYVPKEMRAESIKRIRQIMKNSVKTLNLLKRGFSYNRYA